ncbi:MAG: 50S ribosomal protein L18 [Candidatus Dojkabacteria bacterium]
MASQRTKRHLRIRKKVSGTLKRPRVSVYRSNKSLQVQLIDDEGNRTLAGMSTKSLKNTEGTKTEKARALGKAFAEEIKKLEKGKYTKVVFDRGGYRFHGRVKALADSLREHGIEF